MLLKPFILERLSLEELVAPEVKSGCRDRAKNTDGQTPVKAGNAFYLESRLEGFHDGRLRCILNLKLCLHCFDRVQASLADC